MQIISSRDLKVAETKPNQKQKQNCGSGGWGWRRHKLYSLFQMTIKNGLWTIKNGLYLIFFWNQQTVILTYCVKGNVNNSKTCSYKGERPKNNNKQKRTPESWGCLWPMSKASLNCFSHLSIFMKTWNSECEAWIWILKKGKIVVVFTKVRNIYSARFFKQAISAPN